MKTSVTETIPSLSLPIESSAIPFASVKVTSRARNDTTPSMAKSWTSLGNNRASVSAGDTIVIFAQVQQGIHPVVGVKVTAYLDREDKVDPIQVTLLDSGLDPDNVANDLIYARYLTNFDPHPYNTWYSLKCQVEGTPLLRIHRGFRSSGVRKLLPDGLAVETPIYCGSDTVTEDSILIPTGNFT